MKTDMRGNHRLWTAGCALAVTASLLVAAGLGLGSFELDAMRAETEGLLKAHVVLQPGAAPADAAALGQELGAWPEVASVTVRDGATNLAFLRQTSNEPLRGLSADEVPTTVVVAFTSPADGLAATRSRLTGLTERPGVVGVEASPDEVVAMARAFGPMSLLALILAGVSLLGGALVVANLQGANVLSRKDEIEVLRLVGASDRHVVWPMVRDSIWTGAIGGSLATSAVVVAAVVGPGLVAAVLPESAGDPLLTAAITLASLLTLGIVVSLAGTSICVRRYVRQVEGVA